MAAYIAWSAISTISNAPNAWTDESVAVNTVVAGAGSSGPMAMAVAKVSTPGPVYVTVGYTYRLIAT